ncbi:hypothetical protein L798_04216 [Zootermopsis nevadensis]|uniref:Uncharacterized protein n=1 Tax=Zootermopsis nevadensis TaxID=136037 RepID=A0A067RE24_ZOONE|nr:hypothetical protein L798_04216 [Zootermopsis nevadensis]
MMAYKGRGGKASDVLKLGSRWSRSHYCFRDSDTQKVPLSFQRLTCFDV